MSESLSWLPPLIKLEDHGGNWSKYLEVIYSHFRNDFIETSLHFMGRRLGLKSHPIHEGKEATFWHFISSGSQEEERIPDLRRCERIRWPRAIIESAKEERKKINAWRNERRGESRIVLAVTDFSYVVILADRRNYLLPWTAYCVWYQHQQRKFRQEYDNAIKAGAALL